MASFYLPEISLISCMVRLQVIEYTEMIDISQDLLWDRASYPNRSRSMSRSDLIAALKAKAGIYAKDGCPIADDLLTVLPNHLLCNFPGESVE